MQGLELRDTILHPHAASRMEHRHARKKYGGRKMKAERISAGAGAGAGAFWCASSRQELETNVCMCVYVCMCVLLGHSRKSSHDAVEEDDEEEDT